MTETDLERDMEAANLPEQDRNEVRMMTEFLRLRKEKQPIPADMKAWLLGKDVPNE